MDFTKKTFVTSVNKFFKAALSRFKTGSGENTIFPAPKHERKRVSHSFYLSAIVLDLACLLFVLAVGFKPAANFLGNEFSLLSPMISPLRPITENKSSHEVFGFAPHWTIDKLDNVNYDVLTTIAYFGVPVGSDGNIDTNDNGYTVFQSDKATSVFKKAHAHGTRVVLTLTQMDNNSILSLMDNPDAQQKTIDQAVDTVKKRGIDGINVDFEYMGDPGDQYRNQFSAFVAKLTDRMHQEIPSSHVTVSVYASAVRDPKIYDIHALSQSTDGIFMMAYDYAVSGSENAMPTAPLYGYKSGTYWYDVSTAVDDFLTQMPADKLILGVPWYGYNYAVSKPAIKAPTNRGYYVYNRVKTKKGTRLAKSFVKIPSLTQTYAIAADIDNPDESDAQNVTTGWDNEGQVGYTAYYSPTAGSWRMIFIEDTRSLGIKYDFAKDKHLAGVGMWALGFDEGTGEMWDLLSQKFGDKEVNSQITDREINNGTY